MSGSKSRSSNTNRTNTYTQNTDNRDQRVFNTVTDHGAIEAAEKISLEGLEVVETIGVEAFAFAGDGLAILTEANKTMGEVAVNALEQARDVQFQTLVGAENLVRENADLARDLVEGGQTVALAAINSNEAGTDRVLQAVEAVDRGGAEEVSKDLIKWIPVSMAILAGIVVMRSGK